MIARRCPARIVENLVRSMTHKRVITSQSSLSEWRSEQRQVLVHTRFREATRWAPSHAAPGHRLENLRESTELKIPIESARETLCDYRTTNLLSRRRSRPAIVGARRRHLVRERRLAPRLISVRNVSEPRFLIRFSLISVSNVSEPRFLIRFSLRSVSTLRAVVRACRRRLGSDRILVPRLIAASNVSEPRFLIRFRLDAKARVHRDRSLRIKLNVRNLRGKEARSEIWSTWGLMSPGDALGSMLAWRHWMVTSERLARCWWVWVLTLQLQGPNPG